MTPEKHETDKRSEHGKNRKKELQSDRVRESVCKTSKKLEKKGIVETGRTRNHVEVVQAPHFIHLPVEI